MDYWFVSNLPASAAQLWAIFFDVQRVAGLIPGCENVTEVEPLKQFSALMKQKIGPFKLEIPTNIVLGSYTLERYVELSATGRDKFTGTTIDVRMKVNLDEKRSDDKVECTLGIDAEMQVAGRLASLGYPVVKKRSEELFGEFERRLRNELAGFSEPNSSDGAAAPVAPISIANPAAAAPAQRPASVASVATPTPSAAVQAPLASYPQHAYSSHQHVPVPRFSHGVDLVLQWPRVGVSVAVACVVAYVATTAFHQSPGWWFVAPMLGVAAGLGRRAD
jgi:carbon monoxide dehydrogenase subunit G